MIARLSVSHGLILLGALGMFFGNANPVLHLPLAALLYPACLGLLAREDFPFRRGWLCGLIGSAVALYWISWAVHDYGAFPWPLAVPCAVLPGAWVGLWGGLFCFCLSRLSRAESSAFRAALWRRACSGICLNGRGAGLPQVFPGLPWGRPRPAGPC